MPRMTGLLAAAGLTALLGLGGCISAVTQGAAYTSNQSTISADEEKAKAGDADAQYKVGKAYCCSVIGNNPLHNNQKATSWLCKAARQDKAVAQYELGRIYSGHLAKGYNLLGQAGELVDSPPTNLPQALLWYRLGGTHGMKESDDAAEELSKTMTQAQLLEAGKLESAYPNVPCLWNEVFPNNQVKAD